MKVSSKKVFSLRLAGSVIARKRRSRCGGGGGGGGWGLAGKG